MKPWEIPYTCHIVPFSEKECQPNVKREGNDTLGSEEKNFPPPHPTPISLMIFPLPSINLSFFCCHQLIANT